jgi:hypothetical protein
MLQLVPVMGFGAFQAPSSTQSCCKQRVLCSDGEAVPATGFIPPEESPLSVAVPHHCGRSPHVVESPRDNAEAYRSAEAPKQDASTLIQCSLSSNPPACEHAVHAHRSARGPPEGNRGRNRQGRFMWTIVATQPEPKPGHPEPCPGTQLPRQCVSEHATSSYQPMTGACDRSRNASARGHCSGASAAYEKTLAG